MKKTTKALSIGILCAFSLAACTSPSRFDGTSGPTSNEKAKNGAVIGAAIGAVGGYMTGGNKKESRQNALKGALIFGGTGALIGNELDKQEADLRRSMGNDNVLIQNTGDRLIVTLPQDILFATGSANLRSDLTSDLRALASNLQAYPNTSVQIVGHTDNVGDAGYNQRLSVARAESVTRVLMNNGVSGNRLIAIGRGEDQPVSSNLTPEGRERNRRVEIVILPSA